MNKIVEFFRFLEAEAVKESKALLCQSKLSASLHIFTGFASARMKNSEMFAIQRLD